MAYVNLTTMLGLTINLFQNFMIRNFLPKRAWIKFTTKNRTGRLIRAQSCEVGVIRHCREQVARRWSRPVRPLDVIPFLLEPGPRDNWAMPDASR